MSLLEISRANMLGGNFLRVITRKPALFAVQQFLTVEPTIRHLSEYIYDIPCAGRNICNMSASVPALFIQVYPSYFIDLAAHLDAMITHPVDSINNYTKRPPVGSPRLRKGFRLPSPASRATQLPTISAFPCRSCKL